MCLGHESEVRCAEGLICQDIKKPGVNVNSCEKGACKCVKKPELPEAASAEDSVLLQPHVERKPAALGGMCMGHESKVPCAKGLICQDIKKPGLHVNSCEKGACKCVKKP